jgi:hypothetical protein
MHAKGDVRDSIGIISRELEKEEVSYRSSYLLKRSMARAF